MPIKSKVYGQLSTGETVHAFELTDGHIYAEILSYGAIVSSLRVPDASGKLADVLLGFNKLEDWETKNGPYLGAVVGRVGNRIAKGEFSLEGKSYKLAINNGPNALHGGIKGFDKKVWTHRVEGEAVELTYVSPDGEEGYPGKLTGKVRYEVVNKTLRLTYSATTDVTTLVLLTNHAYFNLAGAASGTVFDHHLYVNAVDYVETVGLIPTGKFLPVADTPLDFSKPKPIGRDITKLFPDGYDNCFVIDRSTGGAGLALAARLTDPASKRAMEVYTTEPALQLYTGGCLGTQVGREGVPYVQYGGVCFETQKYPDAIHHSHFPSIVLKPGEPMHSITEFKFI